MRAARGRGWRFIDLAGLGRNCARLYALAGAQIILCPLLVATVFGIAAGVTHAAGSIAAPVHVLLRYGPIVAAGAALLYGLPRIHRRPAMSLVAADLHVDWRRLAIGGGAQCAILAAQLVLVHALTGWPWRFTAPAALPAFVLAILLIPLQAASEELLFRGYLTQALGRVVRSRVLIATVVGSVFGALHLAAYGPLTVPYFCVLSLVFSLVSLRDERLELVIAGHGAMNLFAFATANLTILPVGSISTTHVVAPFNSAAILVLLVDGAMFYGITRLLVWLCCERLRPP
jgi:CAAX protease family protein